MFDVFLSALRHPIAYSGIRHITDLILKEKIHETGEIYSFIFTTDRMPQWCAGQHAIFTLPHHKVEGKTWRAFSVASTYEENEIRIGTIIGAEPSSFKKQLASLQPGDTIRMYGPYGELCLNDKMKKVVGIAGGIGITPFRAIVRDLTHKNSATKLGLIYSARDNQHAYKQELEDWRIKNQNMAITYTATPEEVNSALEQAVIENKNDAYYLLSGPPKMIGTLKDKLISLGISKSHIINDPFKGY